MGEARAAGANCPACAGGSARFWFTKSGYDHFRCARCGHGFVWPVPPREALDDYYKQLSDGYSSGCSWSMEPRHKLALWSDLLDRVSTLCGAGPVIDIGCGSGAFLALARSRGWDSLTGIEISPVAEALARERSGAEIIVGSWREAAPPESRYAVAAMFDVLEHEPEPTALLDFARRALRPGGALLMTVPHVSGVSLRAFGSGAYTVIPPEHLAYYSAASMGHMLSRAGFEMLSCFTCDIYIKEWIRLLPRLNAGGRATGAWNEARYRGVYGRMTGEAALRVIGLANLGLRALRLGDQLVVVARAAGAEGR